MRNLTVDKKIAYSVALITLVASLLVIFLPSEYVMWSAALAFAASAALACAIIKKRSIHSYNKRQVIMIVSVVAVLYVTLYYLSGLKFGFVKSSVEAISPNSLIKRILPLILITACSEILRAVLLAENAKVTAFISYIIGVASAVACAGGILSLRSAYLFADFIGITLFPALTANLLYNYLSKRYGILPNLIYRLILTLYVYIIPIVPNLPQIIPAFILLVLPIITRLFIAALFEKKVRKASRRESKFRFVFPAVAVLIMSGIVLLITCQFRFGILVIATDSMTGEINTGDAVVYESYEHCDRIQENDVIVFTENDRRVVHRVVTINTVDGQTQYITKGDANDGVDPGFRTDRDIVGVVRFKVNYLGYPSLWLRKIFEK